MKTNIGGKLFIKHVRKHLLKNNTFHKIFNLNTLKLSYCCTTSVESIKQHSSKVLSKTNDITNRKCNCRSKPNCPLNGECLTQCLVYKTKSKSSKTSLVYYRTSEEKFKTGYNKHKKLLRTVHAWMRISDRNVCGTKKAMVLITIYYGKSTKISP